MSVASGGCDCGDEQQHCHGLLILHADGTVECSDGDRDGRDAHGETVRCEDVGCRCGAGEAVSA